MNKTSAQYQSAAQSCMDIFLKKTSDYGTSWRVLRIISVVDQIFIKAQRIRNIQTIGNRQVSDDIVSEFQGIVNYAVIGLLQLDFNKDQVEDLTVSEAKTLFMEKIAQARRTMESKNHDYGEAWREMSQESFVDLILMKLLRVRQILANDGKTQISEGIDSNFVDIINYGLFSLILISEGVHKAN